MVIFEKNILQNSIFFILMNVYPIFFVPLQQIITDMDKDINRLKVVLAEKKRTTKWLAKQLGKDPTTISKWCTNSSQPTLEVLLRIAEVLEVDYTELIKR